MTGLPLAGASRMLNQFAPARKGHGNPCMHLSSRWSSGRKTRHATSASTLLTSLLFLPPPASRRLWWTRLSLLAPLRSGSPCCCSPARSPHAPAPLCHLQKAVQQEGRPPFAVDQATTCLGTATRAAALRGTSTLQIRCHPLGPTGLLSRLSRPAGCVAMATGKTSAQSRVPGQGTSLQGRSPQG